MRKASETPRKNPASPAPGATSESAVKASPVERLIELLSPRLETLGYELVHLELQNHRPFTLRLYIDVLADRAEAGGEAIGVEDCAIVSRALDEPLENLPELDAYFGGAYELEVSSPGVDRPLRKARDYEKFAGRDARVHTLRALTADELGNAEYQSRNPKQKNFLGRLNGVVVASDGTPLAVKMTIAASMGKTQPGPGAKRDKKTEKKADRKPERQDDILLPFALIAKANIEPDFDAKAQD